ncbi:MAG: tetratricopeptide repeat protein [Saprospiraceae bacterium]|nr:tetratricopeptide repeat protein [Saprospiraceae bacterium]MCF8250062.1 tetratricopeptide repeat protein [Saprospiraceae bacterium]MCF8279524.1 tetratricopeptide repeat protein [Bacteroidales bacterium]MCF8311972.1 tetratricopeptide repeat protein [Saprospiraceae bacterium]MCF8440338.1 tetratricopeptide repeat protein [Saprospiraceae bacterium]
MKKIPNLLLLFLSTWASIAWGQTNFRTGFEKTDPIAQNSPLTLEEKVKIHQQFYAKALENKDTLHQLFGKLYLATDYVRAQDYAEATRYVLAAEGIANTANNLGWQGWVVHRKGVLSLRMNNYKEALDFYKTAATLCGEAGDSLCVAESLEQVSAMYGRLEDPENAQLYHVIAMPLIEKYGGQAQLGAALNNFGIINSQQGRALESIPYFERSIEIYHQLRKHKEEAKALNNLADAYRLLERYKLAKETFLRCVSMNKQYQDRENLVSNYSGLQTVASEIGDYEAAYENLSLYFLLKDSLVGAETQRKIAELEVKFKTQEKELELEKSNLALNAAQRSIAWQTGVLFFLLLLGGIGLWRWRLQSRQAKRDISHNQETLANLTRILLEKNQQLATMEEKTTSLSRGNAKTAEPADFEENLYNQRILTDADWSSFKVYFERAYPGYLHQLRSAFPALTDSEERLFLFIKLNLTTKEAATILGISADSVKKTRNRLRKKLELEEDVVLEAFIRNF